MWLSQKWMRRVMLGEGKSSSQVPLLENLLKLRIGHSVYMPNDEQSAHYSLVNEQSTSICPAFIRRAFQYSISIKDVQQLKELFVICEQHSFGIPGELVPELWKMFDAELSFSDRYLRMLHPYLNMLSNYFKEYSPCKELPEQEEWQNFTLGEKKLHLESQFELGKHPKALQWIADLPSTQRVELMKETIYRKIPNRTKIAEVWANSRSKKASAVAHAYLLKDKENKFYEKALNFIRKTINFDKTLSIQTEAPLPFSLYAPGITEETSTNIFPLIAWMDPLDVFDHLDIHSTQLSKEIMKLDENEAWVAHILHAAIYHENEEWIKYALEMIRFYDLVNVKYHKQWPSLLQRVKPDIVKDAFAKSLSKAKNDLDRIDALHHWMYAADLFVSRKHTENLWPSIETGLELIAYGELSLEHYKDLFTYIQNRMHPAIAGGWEHKTGIPDFTSKFQSEVKHRYFLYKALNQWLKAKQNN